MIESTLAKIGRSTKKCEKPIEASSPLREAHGVAIYRQP
jgi:hypothetical protein